MIHFSKELDLKRDQKFYSSLLKNIHESCLLKLQDHPFLSGSHLAVRIKSWLYCWQSKAAKLLGFHSPQNIISQTWQNLEFSNSIFFDIPENSPNISNPTVYVAGPILLTLRWETSRHCSDFHFSSSQSWIWISIVNPHYRRQNHQV